MFKTTSRTDKYTTQSEPRTTDTSSFYSPNYLIAALSVILATATFSVIGGTLWSLVSVQSQTLPSNTTNTSQRVLF